MAEFEINGATYRTGRLDPIRQIILAKRLAPIVGGILKLLGNIGSDEQTLSAFGSAIHDLSDDDTRFIISECLSVTERSAGEGQGWARVQSSNGQLMFQDDMGMEVILNIIFRAIMENLGPTIASAKPNLSALAGA